jgi:pimeloyl-ACP methyl ester carboxylesterase
LHRAGRVQERCGQCVEQGCHRACGGLGVAAWLTKRGDAVTARWTEPVRRQPGIRRDAVRVLRTAAADGRRLLAETALRLREFDRPALVVWASEDRVVPPGHGTRPAELLPRGRLVEVTDGYPLLPLDRPAELARIIGGFARASAPPAPA